MCAVTRAGALTCLLAILAACTSPSAAPSHSPTPTRAAEPRVAPLPAAGAPSCEAPVVAGPRVTSPAQAAVLVDVCKPGTRDGPQIGALRAYPVELPSLTPLPGVRPISLQHHFRHALSPDGRTLAVILWPTDTSAGGKLHFIDVPNWTISAGSVEIDAGIERLEFTPDGSALYWLKPTTFDSAHGMPRSYALYRYAVATGALSEMLRLPASFMPYEHRIVGDRLAVYGVPTSNKHLAEGPPQLYLIDLARSTVTSVTTLSGMRAGQVERASDPDRWPWLYLRPGVAWDVPRQRLFVVDAETDRAFVVDLASGALRGPLPFLPRRSSLFDDLLRWFFPIAEAKMVAETGRRVVVSPDGAHLYVQGLRSDFVKREGSWREVVTPLGLRILESASMTEVGRIDETVDELGLSPDGKLLAYVTFRVEDSGQEWAKRSAYRLHLLDAATSKAVASTDLDGASRLVTFAPDGRVAYVASMGTPPPRVLAVSTSTGERLGEVLGSAHFIELLPLWRALGR